MSETNEVVDWLVSSLFVFGVLLVPLGLSFLLIPEKVLQLGEKLNAWVHTDHLFDFINKPRYQERLVYRYHHVFGILVTLFAALCVYMMYFNTDVAVLLERLSRMMETEFGKWLIVSLYYILLAANIGAFVIGLIILIRPSVLKTLGDKANLWIDSEEKLKVLDNTRDLPESVFPGNPRIFGILILMGAIYIIANTKFVLI
ncbi:MAG: hypothetical protein GY784_02445 [Gammaproteobacteria bacterium]|nr:hypothetical protein [Gammaproteobacteria bacterium]